MTARSAQLSRIALTIGVVAVLPWIVPSFVVFDLIYVGAYAIAILGLIVLTGMNGQISLGHGAFLAVGAYIVAILAHDAGWPYWAAVPMAALGCGILGLLLGLVALRLAGVYLALATFSLAVATPSILKHFKDLTGGYGGLSLNPVTPPDRIPLDAQHWLYYVTWAVVGIVFLLTAQLVRGKFGRALRGLRDNPTAAESFGVNPYYYKTFAFGWSAALAGVAGAFYAFATAYLSPDSFTVALSITLLIGAVLGGILTFWGALVGAVVVEFLPLLAQQISAGAPGVVYGIALILVMLFVPDGIVGGCVRLYRRALRKTVPNLGPEPSIQPAAPVTAKSSSRD